MRTTVYAVNSSAISHRCGVPAGIIRTSPLAIWISREPSDFVPALPRPLPARIRSYRIGQHGPPPVLAIEVLSRRSFQQQDLTNKPVLYAQLGVAEYRTEATEYVEPISVTLLLSCVLTMVGLTRVTESLSAYQALGRLTLKS